MRTRHSPVLITLQKVSQELSHKQASFLALFAAQFIGRLVSVQPFGFLTITDVTGWEILKMWDFGFTLL